MTDTDHLLKQLVSTFMVDFATWLLGTPIQTVQPFQRELPASTVTVDQVFQVLLPDKRNILLHIEFQGRRSHAPMRWRMLEYMQRLATLAHLDLESVVLYLGRGAGANDTGVHHLNGLDGTPSLAWRYRVIRLWQMPAEELLATERIAPLALVGQTQISNPQTTLTEVVARMRRIADIDLRGHLVSALLTMLTEEEMMRMVEQLFEEDDVLADLDLPYLRRLREKSIAEGLAEGRARGHAEGHAEGRHDGEVELLLRQLHIRFGALPEEVLTRLTNATTEELLHWSERILTAPTLEAVFAK